MIVRYLLLSSLVGVGLAAQPSAPSPVAAPLRDLQWGQLNFFHTSDTHGWHAGHLQEPSFSGDWGDYISFAQHMRDRADKEGVDVLLVDTGDRIEGNGLYDASEPRGKYTYEVFKEQDIDLICSGNHELYRENASVGEFYHTVPNYKNNYIASNLDIINPETGNLEPLAQRFKTFTTKNQGIKITAFGFLFDFTGNANNTVIQRVHDTVKEDWFLEAIKDSSVDLFVVIGHVAPRSQEYKAIYKAIREARWDAPIQFFAGHTHIRDFKQWDSKSTAIESGRYMETIGFLSITGLHGSPSPSAKLSFGRRYIDNNLFSLLHHSNKTKDEFPTERGQNVTDAIAAARKELGLDHVHGCAPRNLWMSRAPYPSKHSVHSWIEEHILPDSIGSTYLETLDDSDNQNPLIILTNTGAIRFDVFAGAFTRDTTYLVSPFTSDFRVIKDVPYPAAGKLLEVLNKRGHIWTSDASISNENMLVAPEQIGRATVDRERQAAIEAMYAPNFGSHQEVLGDLEVDVPAVKDLPPGYTTVDDFGSDGDDTEHSKIKFYHSPNCVEARVGFHALDKDKAEKVDVIYNAFLQPHILAALRFLGQEFENDDTRTVAKGKTLTEYITEWVEENWALGDEEDCDSVISPTN